MWYCCLTFFSKPKIGFLWKKSYLHLTAVASAKEAKWLFRFILYLHLSTECNNRLGAVRPRLQFRQRLKINSGSCNSNSRYVGSKMMYYIRSIRQRILTVVRMITVRLVASLIRMYLSKVENILCEYNDAVESKLV